MTFARIAQREQREQSVGCFVKLLREPSDVGACLHDSGFEGDRAAWERAGVFHTLTTRQRVRSDTAILPTVV